MKATELVYKIFKKFLPNPFTIAVILSITTFFIALIFTNKEADLITKSFLLFNHWEQGLWNAGLLVFAVQMMLMLVLGHALALTKPVNKIIKYFSEFCSTTSRAVAIVSFMTMLVALFNWGLGLIFGAIFSRKVAEDALERKVKINYPMVAAAGYSGMLVWHGGLSGSSLVKVAEPNHLINLLQEAGASNTLLNTLPTSISYSETVFGTMNMVVSILILISVPLTLYLVGKKVKSTEITIKHEDVQVNPGLTKIVGAERLDHSKWLALYFGLVVLGGVIYKFYQIGSSNFLSYFTPNNINFMLLGLGLVLHSNFSIFLNTIDKAIGGVSGILIQFPLYFGILGIMNHSGLVNNMSDFFVSISNETTFPVFTFISAGIVNFFVPSGGGQWAIQGPLIVKAATELNIPLSKAIMALAYGDQLTNMVQPFWALPLLGITQLKAKQLLPYTFILLVVGAVAFSIGLLLF